MQHQPATGTVHVRSARFFVLWCKDKKCVVAHQKVRAPGVALGAAGKRCRGNAHAEQRGSDFRANEAAERFPAAWAYVWLLAARTQVKLRVALY